MNLVYFILGFCLPAGLIVAFAGTGVRKLVAKSKYKKHEDNIVLATMGFVSLLVVITWAIIVEVYSVA